MKDGMMRLAEVLLQVIDDLEYIHTQSKHDSNFCDVCLKITNNRRKINVFIKSLEEEKR